jgi:hypothetical protein
VRASRQSWALWIVVTSATVPASAWLWLIGGMSTCGEEVYDTLPGSVGDTLCSALVRPVVPWALIASIPTLLAAVGGFVSIRLRRRDLFLFALAAPFAIVVIATSSLTAIF